MKKSSTPTPTGCCPIFDPATWDEKQVTWKHKLFIQDEVIQLFHIPLNMGQVVTRMFDKIKAANAAPPDKDFLMLAYDPSPWKSEIYMTVTKAVDDAKTVKLSGTFMTKVFDGPFNAVPQWIKEMDCYVANKGKQVKKYYFFFTTCPKCAKAYKHNYVVVFAQID